MQVNGGLEAKARSECVITCFKEFIVPHRTGFKHRNASCINVKKKETLLIPFRQKCNFLLEKGYLVRARCK
jgi:hypothetical protein